MSSFTVSAVRISAARDITAGHYQQQEIPLLGITGSKRHHCSALPAARDITVGHYRQQAISLLGITDNKQYHCWALTQKVISAVNMTGLLKTSIQSVHDLWTQKFSTGTSAKIVTSGTLEYYVNQKWLAQRTETRNEDKALGGRVYFSNACSRVGLVTATECLLTEGSICVH